MAAVTTLKKVSVNIRLDNGTDAQGNAKTVTISLGSLSRDNFNADKALAVAAALEPCLSNTLNSVEKVEVSTIAAA